MNFDVNYFAVLVSAISFMIIGFLWYGPFFGKTWMKLAGVTPESMKNQPKTAMPRVLGITFICALVISFVLDALLKNLLITTLGNALTLAIVVWIGFVATTMLNRVLFERSPFKLYLINASQYLVAFIIAALILVSCPW